MDDAKSNDKKISKALDKIIDILNKNKLTISEMIVMYGNLGYHIGASIAGIEKDGPNIEELRRMYYIDPTIDIGLMLQGLMITDWEKDFLKTKRISKIAQENRLAKRKEKE